MEEIVTECTWKKEFSAMTEDDIRAFSLAIGDRNPIHHDNETARKIGLAGIVAPGVRIVGFASSAIAEKLPGAMVRRLSMQFIKPLYARTPLIVSCTVVKKRNVSIIIIVSIKDTSGGTIAEGECKAVFLPEG